MAGVGPQRHRGKKADVLVYYIMDFNISFLCTIIYCYIKYRINENRKYEFAFLEIKIIFINKLLFTSTFLTHMFLNCCVTMAFIRAETCSTITRDSNTLSTQQFRLAVLLYLLNYLRITIRCLTLKSGRFIIFSVLFFLSFLDSAVKLKSPLTNILKYFSSFEYVTIYK